MDNKLIGYSLHPISKKAAGGFATACLLTDMVTGKTLSTSGGGAYAISPEVFELLDRDEDVRALILSKLAG